MSNASEQCVNECAYGMRARQDLAWPSTVRETGRRASSLVLLQYILMERQHNERRSNSLQAETG